MVERQPYKAVCHQIDPRTGAKLKRAPAVTDLRRPKPSIAPLARILERAAERDIEPEAEG
jgi:hypothetical protein